MQFSKLQNGLQVQYNGAFQENSQAETMNNAEI